MKNKEFLQKVQKIYLECFLKLKPVIESNDFMKAVKPIDGYECTKDIQFAMDMYMDEYIDETIYTSYPELLGASPNGDELNEYWHKINIDDDDFMK